MTELKPCPFCGGNNIEVMRVFTVKSRYEFEVFCLTCKAAGPSGYRPDEAIDAWNRRVID